MPRGAMCRAFHPQKKKKGDRRRSDSLRGLPSFERMGGGGVSINLGGAGSRASQKGNCVSYSHCIFTRKKGSREREIEGDSPATSGEGNGDERGLLTEKKKPASPVTINLSTEGGAGDFLLPKKTGGGSSVKKGEGRERRERGGGDVTIPRHTTNRLRPPNPLSLQLRHMDRSTERG